jgi:hypothetical protein
MTARARLARGETLTGVERFMSFVYERMVTPAIDEDAVVAREWLKVQQMRDVSPPWVGLYMVLRVLVRWFVATVRGHRPSTCVHGPPRAALLGSFGMEDVDQAEGTREDVESEPPERARATAASPADSAPARP